MNSDMRQSPEYQELLRRLGSRVEAVGGEQAAYLSRIIPLPRPTWMVIQRAWDPAVLAPAAQAARRWWAVSIKVAPQAIPGSPEAGAWETALREHGYRPDKIPIAPTKTIRVPLGFSETDLLGQMKSKTRYNIRLSQRRGVCVRVLDGKQIGHSPADFDAFYHFFQSGNRLVRLTTGSRRPYEALFKAFGEKVFVVFAYIGRGELGAVATYMVTGDTVWYQLNRTTAEGRRDFAANLAVWEGMREGQRRGCRWFDFDGVYDERFPDEAWKGFSRFKAGFGGEEVAYLGSYVKWWPWSTKKL
jgi:hypothetical protein